MIYSQRHLNFTLTICLAGLIVFFGCATIEAPSGGEPDTTPPEVIFCYPDSGSTNLSVDTNFELIFSEKVVPIDVDRLLEFYPNIGETKYKWSKRKKLSFRFLEALSADTTFVIVLPKGFKDAHKYPSKTTILYPFSTGAHIDSCSLSGSLILNANPVINGIAELYALPPDTLEYFQQDPLRKVETDSLGIYTFDWLPNGGGPYLIRAFNDKNNDRRPGEQEASRLLPGHFLLSQQHTDIGSTVIFDPNTPGTVNSIIRAPAFTGINIVSWTEVIDQENPEWLPADTQIPSDCLFSADGDTVCWTESGPGDVRLIAFADVNNDSLFTVNTDTVSVDSIVAFYEPHLVFTDIFIEPGLPTDIGFPDWPDTLAPAVIDSTVSEEK